MDRATRSELVKTVEAQQEKLNRYEAKLRGTKCIFFLFRNISDMFKIFIIG